MKKVLALALTLAALTALFAVTGVFVNASEAEKAPTVEELQDEIEKLESTLAELTVQIKEVKDASEEDIAAWMSRADQLNEEIASLKDALTNETAENDELWASITNLKESLLFTTILAIVTALGCAVCIGIVCFEKKKN